MRGTQLERQGQRAQSPRARVWKRRPELQDRWGSSAGSFQRGTGFPRDRGAPRRGTVLVSWPEPGIPLVHRGRAWPEPSVSAWRWLGPCASVRPCLELVSDPADSSPRRVLTVVGWRRCVEAAHRRPCRARSSSGPRGRVERCEGRTGLLLTLTSWRKRPLGHTLRGPKGGALAPDRQTSFIFSSTDLAGEVSTPPPPPFKHIRPLLNSFMLQLPCARITFF